VLIGANMPSILAEISFLTNSEDARELQQPPIAAHRGVALSRSVAIHQRLERRRLAESSGRPNGNEVANSTPA